MEKQINGVVRQQDIADALGVSLNTVSHALRDCPDISKETIAKVKAKAKELGYIPNNIASYLVNGKTSFVAIIFPSLENPYYLIMINFLLEDLKKHNLDILLIPVGSNLDYQIVEKVILNRCGGVITFVELNESVIKAFNDRNIPIILLGSKTPYTGLDAIYTDDYDGGKQVAEQFINSKCHNAVYVGNSFAETSKRRAKGFLDEIAKQNLKDKKVSTYFLEDQEYNDFSKLYKFIEDNNFDFIFTHNDELAVNIRRHFNDKKNVTYFGYDNISSYLYICERINSVGGDYKEIAKCAAESMERLLQGNNDKKNSHHVFPVSISLNE